MEFLKRKVSRHLDWLDLDKEICNEKSTTSVTWFNLFTKVNEVDVSHTLPENGKESIGFIKKK